MGRGRFSGVLCMKYNASAHISMGQLGMLLRGWLVGWLDGSLFGWLVGLLVG